MREQAADGAEEIADGLEEAGMWSGSLRPGEVQTPRLTHPTLLCAGYAFATCCQEVYTLDT